MKNKILVVSVLVFTFVFAHNTYAIGQNNSTEAGNQIQQQTQTSNQGENNQIQTQNNEQTQDGTVEQVEKDMGTKTQGKDETGNQVQNQNQIQDQSEASQVKNKEQEEKINTETHRSTVANFVQGILKTASTTKNEIGQQIRVIAQQQNQSESTTIQAMEKVQERSKVRTFFFGSDYKNLGALRSEMVQTRNRLEQLNGLMINTQNEGDKMELKNQIQVLEQEQAKIENFIKTQENKFSLFGWMFRLFNK